MGNFSRFFIERPIFASVIAIIITLAGVVASQVLPVAQYPEIAPPTVSISATYPGASAETLAKTVAAPIEEQLSGVENMIYFSSSAAADGSVTITATFEVGTDVDKAVFQINNRVEIAMPRLPEEVRRNGVVVRKRSNDILLVVGVFSPNGTHATVYLADYATVNLVDELKRIPGVGDVTLFGSGYAMRIWLKPDKMARLGVTPTDIANAIRAQNQQYAAGKIGAEPAPAGQALTYTVTARGRLVRAEEFADIVVRAGGPEGVLRIKDVARVELGAQSYDTATSVDGKPAVGMGVYLQTGANALEVSAAVKARMKELAAAFPPDVAYIIPFDTTHVVEASISEVVTTLAEAAVLVLLVVFVFLQHWRATLIPMIAVPVSLIGTFAGLYMLGFSINTLTLFAMVLAVGIVVDDAIVVLENVERLMREQGMSARQAAIESMYEVSGAVLAIVLVLSAVFIPVAFLGGIAGQLYKQFAVTVAIAVGLSGLTALTLTPALCALLLKAGAHESRFLRPFNIAFGKLTALYLWMVNLTLRHRALATLAFLGLLGVTAMLFVRVPGSFVPPEDQGYLITSIQLPDAATLQRTAAVGAQFQAELAKEPAIDHTFFAPGRDFIGGGNKPNAGTSFVLLKDWNERAKTAPQIVADISRLGRTFNDGMALAFNPPAIRGLGSAGGFELYVQSRAGSDAHALGKVVHEFAAALAQHPQLQNVNTFYRASVPQLFVQVDLEQAMALGVPVNDIYDALQSTLGTLYVNDFNMSGRTYRVQVQADAPYRAQPEDLGRIHVRSNTSGEMIPLRTFLHVSSIVGPEQVERYNGFLAAKVLGAAKPGVSSGEAIAAVEQVAAQVLPAGYTMEWTGQAFQEKRAGAASIFAFGFAIVMVYLILAALYERWGLPTAVVLAVPFAVLGALLLVALRGMQNDIYFQIGLVVLIGLAAKNAILIVEFAQQGVLAGKAPAQAAVEAARLRFRPIVMTSIAFVFGVLPLAVASGAGAAARRSMGTGVVGGMLLATFVATIFVPLFFTLFARRKKRGATQVSEPVGPNAAQERR
ncbi:MAG: multidrug efflux RND transporter permease subunit [Burkholderiales bacterium]|nr:multidrug efflux RND transporter permease subunit [Burkholderiales bacterium]